MARNKPIPEVRLIQYGPVTNVYTKTSNLKLMVMSDVHFDSPFCNRTQFLADLDYAKEVGALVVIVGDFFDAMQGRFDPRRSMDTLRPEYRREDYYDFIVEDAIEYLKPYRRSILLISPGNHELSVLKNANTDLMRRFTRGLSIPTHKVQMGGYGGVIGIHFKNNGHVPIKYFHGAGGEAPVTKGVIQTNRQAAYLDGFVVVLNGHNHNMYYVPLARERVKDGRFEFMLQHHVRTPGYAMTYGDGTAGWEVTRGGIPKPIGSVLLDIYEDEHVDVYPRISPPVPIKAPENLYEGPVYSQDPEGS